MTAALSRLSDYFSPFFLREILFDDVLSNPCYYLVERVDCPIDVSVERWRRRHGSIDGCLEAELSAVHGLDHFIVECFGESLPLFQTGQPLEPNVALGQHVEHGGSEYECARTHDDCGDEVSRVVREVELQDKFSQGAYCHDESDWTYEGDQS